MKLRPVILSLFLVFLFSCEKDEISMSQEAAGFLNEVLDIMESNSINRQEIEWSDFRNKVIERASEAQSIDETYGAVRLALTLLEDNHSFFKKPDGSYMSGSSSISCSAESLALPSIPEGIGYVKINTFAGSDPKKNIDHAEFIQEQIKEADSTNIKGWIVDLRGNGGGNMWPMLAGIGPILGEGTAGFFIDPDNAQSSWGYANGASILNQTPLVHVSNPYTLVHPNPKVAVLLNNAIASSGEAIAISFVGRDNTKSFGTATCGLSTANSGFNLSNGATLILTVSYMADRNKRKYGVPVTPDMESNSQTIIEDAIAYIEN